MSLSIVNKMRIHSLLIALLFLCFSLESRASSPSESLWPVHFSSILASNPECKIQDLSQSLPSSIPLSPLTRELTHFLQSQHCRFLKLKSIFERNPGFFCPGVSFEENYPNCYKKILEKLLQKVGLDLSGFILLSSVGIQPLVVKKKQDPRSIEEGLTVVEMGWINLKALKQRTKPSSFLRKIKNQTDDVKKEARDLDQMDEELTAKFAIKLIETARNILDQADRRSAQDQSAFAPKRKVRILRNQRELLDQSLLWHAPPSTISTPVQ